jgi:hypothetical protein
MVGRWRKGTAGRTSVGALIIVGFATAIGACGDRVSEEATPPAVDMELALGGAAEPELADVGDAVEPAGETPGAVAQRPSPPPPSPTPAPTPPPAEETSPVRGVPPAAEAPMVPEEEAPPEIQMISLTAAVGSELEAELIDELSTKDNQPGDRFQLRVTSPLIDGHRVIVQQNALIFGEVTALQESGAEGETAVIKVTFHEVSFAGTSWPFSATVVEADPQTKGRYSTGDKAARIGAGAVAGAILGRVIGGNSKGTVIGAAVGAAAGTAITLVTEDVDAVLPAGSILRLRLDRPLVITVPAG